MINDNFRILRRINQAEEWVHLNVRTMLNGYMCYGVDSSLDAYTLGQSVGLRDKKGMMIFDGDYILAVLKIDYYKPEYITIRQIYQVYHAEFELRLDAIRPAQILIESENAYLRAVDLDNDGDKLVILDKWVLHNQTRYRTQDIEIVGNIHERKTFI